MSVLNDLFDAVGSYVRDSVELDIVDVDQPGSTINVREVCSFKAQVQNAGLLRMVNVALEIEGKGGAKVSTSNQGPWSTSVVVNGMSVPAGGTVASRTLYFQAPNEETDYSTLLSVHVKGWDGDIGALINTASTEESGRYGHLITSVAPS
jgi:hypothetical protein